MTKKALLIGINYLDYGNASVPKLNGCVNDIVEVSKMLMDAYNYKREDIIMLRDDLDDATKKPTGENIVKAFNTLKNQSNASDEIWIHFSGHGSFIQDTNNDERDGRDEIIIPSDFHNGAISDDYLFSVLNQLKCITFITMDCCHSGTICDLTYSFRNDVVRNGRTYYRRQIEKRRRMRNRNIYMLSGSRDDQYAMDGYNYEKNIAMGAFTHVLTEGLRHFNHNVSMLQLHQSLTNTLKHYGFDQRCVLSSSNPYPFMRFTKHGIMRYH